MANKAAVKKPASVSKAPAKLAKKAAASPKKVKPAKKVKAVKPPKPDAAKSEIAESTSSKALPTRPLEVRSLETRVADLTDRSEMLAARVAALELALRKVLEYWPQGRSKLRKALHARSKRVARTIEKAVPVVDRPSWQKAVDELIAAID